MDSEFCFFINTFGFIKSASQQPKIQSTTQFIYHYNFDNYFGETIYVKTNDVDDFFKNDADKFQNPFILITGAHVDSIYENNPHQHHKKLLKWYAQNYEGKETEIMKHLPLGLDYHTLQLIDNHRWGDKMSSSDQEKMMMQIKKDFIPIHKTISTMALANFQNTTYGPPLLREQRRKPILETLQKKSCIKFLPTQKRHQFWKSMKYYAFIISPVGYGLDTHRTWEALILNRIPIVNNSKIKEVYKNLPVLLVNDFNEITETWLDYHFKQIVNNWDNYDWKKLELKYWQENIKSIYP
jgi:hypothetical protein